MAAKRRRWSIKSGKHAWLTLALGVGIGVIVVVLWQFAEKRWHTREGIATLFESAGKAVKPDTRKDEPAKTEAAKGNKPKYDFYTILPETETVLPDRSVRTKPDTAGKAEAGVTYVLQAGSFPNFQDADELKAKLAINGLVAQIQKVSIEGRGDFYRVRLGPYNKLETMDATEQQLKQLGVAKPLAIKVRKGPG
jgi:cell division protein FtsN